MWIIVETFYNVGEPSKSKIRVRPVTGAPTDMRVSCSKALRSAWTVPQCFRVFVTTVSAEGRDSYLRVSEDLGWTPIDHPHAAKRRNSTRIKNGP